MNHHQGIQICAYDKGQQIALDVIRTVGSLQGWWYVGSSFVPHVWNDFALISFRVQGQELAVIVSSINCLSSPADPLIVPGKHTLWVTNLITSRLIMLGWYTWPMPCVAMRYPTPGRDWTPRPSCQYPLLTPPYVCTRHHPLGAYNKMHVLYFCDKLTHVQWVYCCGSVR